MTVNQVFGHLADDPEISQESQVQLFQRDVFAVLDQAADFVPDTVAHLEYLSGFGPGAVS